MRRDGRSRGEEREGEESRGKLFILLYMGNKEKAKGGEIRKAQEMRSCDSNYKIE